MDGNKNSIIRMVLILLAIAAVVLTVVQVIRLSDSGDDQPQADLSGYGSQTDDIPSVSQSDGLYFEDDGTMEMDSIPNDALTSGADAAPDMGDAE